MRVVSNKANTKVQEYSMKNEDFECSFGFSCISFENSYDYELKSLRTLQIKHVICPQLVLTSKVSNKFSIFALNVALNRLLK